MKKTDASSRWRMWAPLFGSACITVGFVLLILYFHNASDKSRRVQLALARVEAQDNVISALEWELMATREVNEEVFSDFRRARTQLLEARSVLLQGKQASLPLEQFRIACDAYMQAIDREMALAETGKFDEASKLDDSEVDPHFAQLMRSITHATQTYSSIVESTRAHSRQGLIGVAVISLSMIFFFMKLFDRQHRRFVTQRAIHQLDERFRVLTEHSADLVIVCKRGGAVTYASPSIKAALGIEPEAFVRENIAVRVHPEDASRLLSLLATVTAAHANPSIELRLAHVDGSWRIFDCLIQDLSRDARVAGLLLNGRDVTDRKHVEQKLAFNAGHDALTQLPNRALFMERLEDVLGRARRKDRRVALLYLDVDGFKIVNDCLGHDAGDLLLNEFGKRLSKCVRRDDLVGRALVENAPLDSDGTVARLGGDEFIVLLEEIKDPSDAIRVAERIHSAMREPFTIHGQEVFKSTSIGIALCSGNMSAATLVSNADTAMYRAKVNGKSRWEIFDSAMHAQVTERLEMESALRRALELREFRVYFQPIVDVISTKVVGFEALLRWERPAYGLVPPASFIQIAEECGLIVAIGEWVLYEACRAAKTWPEPNAEGDPLYVTVNVSAKQFSYPTFVEQVQQVLRATQIDPRRLKLELTESTAMENTSRTEAVLARLEQLGVRLCIDDFGTGYSSLSSLRRFPVDTLKIDRSFVTSMVSNPQSYAIVCTIIGLARTLQVGVVAEGVETIEQLEKLKRGMCDCAQGYLLARPMPEDSVAGFLRALPVGKTLSHASGAGT